MRKMGPEKKMKIAEGQKGYILLTSCLLLSVLSVFSLALFSRFWTFMDATERNRNKIVAFNMAEGGLDQTLRGLALNPNYGGSGGYVALGTNAGYNVSVCPPTCPSGITPPANPQYRWIQAVGYAPGNDNSLRAYDMRPTIAYAELDNTPFDFGAFGDTTLTLNGVVKVDSYDSRNGAYGGLNIGSQGDVASDGAISFIGNPQVNGNVVQNPGIDCGPATTTLPSSGALNIAGSTNYQLPSGTYHFSSISVTGNGKLTLLGPVTIYLDGTASIGGNGVATSANNPVNFMLYATGANSISVSGNGNFYGAVYAPKSDVQYTGNGDFYGGVMANAYQQSGTNSLHYDVALKDVTAPCTQVHLRSWQENNKTATL